MKLLLLVFSFFPLFAYAVEPTVRGLARKIAVDILNPLIGVLFALAFVVFLWGIIQYVIGSQGDERRLEQGKKVMIWGIVGLFIMASAWGIVQILCNFFGTACKF